MPHDRHRVRRDAAGVGPDPTLAGRLYRLSDTRDYRIARGEPDIRGWEVRTLAGGEVGEVDDLLIDPHRGEVVMVDIDLENSDQHINVPIRGVEIDHGRHCVVVDSGDIRNARESFVRGVVDTDDRDRARYDDNRRLDDRMADARIDENTEEVVIDRRPIIEETVIRRRVVDRDKAEAEE